MKLILDYSRWRCGGYNESTHQLGEGLTKMRNDKGYCCCLGLFATQINPTISEDRLFRVGTPARSGKEIYSLNYYNEETDEYYNTELSSMAMVINDAIDTTPDEKIEALKALFSQYDYDIEVINKPKLKL